MIERPAQLKALRDGLKASPVVALLGPRQCGKTTLARRLAERGATTYLDLENPADLARLAEPMLALERLRELVVIDEVQRRPDLFPVLRVLADRRPLPARFLVLGSASPELLRQTSESLAGRVRFVEMGGFSLDEVGAEHLRRLWVRGGFPRSYLARTEAESIRWREDFIRTFLERDLPQFGIRVPAAAMRRFWMMLAHYAGGIWSGSEVWRSLGASWASFAMEQVVARAGAREAYYGRTQAGAEIDLFLMLRGKRVGIEMKYSDAPGMTRSLAAALADLRLDRLLVVHPGKARFPLGKKVEALPLADCLREVAKLGGR